MSVKLTLKAAWEYRLEVREEGRTSRAKSDRLWCESTALYEKGRDIRAEGDKLKTEDCKIRTEGVRLQAEGNEVMIRASVIQTRAGKLRTKADKLRNAGKKFWAEAVLKLKGDILMEWKWVVKDDRRDRECHLETGEVFKP